MSQRQQLFGCGAGAGQWADPVPNQTQSTVMAWTYLCVSGWLGFLLLVLRSHAIEIRNPSGTHVKPTATKGMVIDAGSGGSRLHVYTWQPRIFSTVPPPLSYPEPNEKWTARVDPGIHNFPTDMSKVADHLAQLIDYAKLQLVGFEHEFVDYPLYFKATGGMRELDYNSRERIIDEVRRLLSDKSFCPFFFRDDFARVISGEEEAVFSWTATNFLLGTLLPNSMGIGEVQHVNTTYGTLDLGGASTQIAFYVPSQNMLEGLYKLQIGLRQWNVYAKSFLQFGMVSARLRHLTALADAAVAASKPTDKAISIVNYCFHAGYSEPVLDSSETHTVTVIGPSVPDPQQLQKCRASILPMMRKDLDAFCNVVYHGDCSLAGAYQPPIPTGKHGHFMGQSSYKYPWAVLLLPQTATLLDFETRAQGICKFNFEDMMTYYDSNGIANVISGDKVADLQPHYCFMSGYVLTLLEDGYRFSKNHTLTVVDSINGNKVGWALGAILYEINQLPWELKMNALEKYPMGFTSLALVLGFGLGIAAAVLVYRELAKEKPAEIAKYRSLNEADAVDFKRLEEAQQLLKKSNNGSFMSAKANRMNTESPKFVELGSKKGNGSFIKQKGMATGDRVKTFGPGGYQSQF